GIVREIARRRWCACSSCRAPLKGVFEILRTRDEVTEGAEETAKHGDTKKRRHTEGGSTGVAKRRALPDRIGNASAIPARSVRVSDPIQQRQVGLLRRPTRRTALLRASPLLRFSAFCRFLRNFRALVADVHAASCAHLRGPAVLWSPRSPFGIASAAIRSRRLERVSRGHFLVNIDAQSRQIVRVPHGLADFRQAREELFDLVRKISALS